MKKIIIGVVIVFISSWTWAGGPNGSPFSVDIRGKWKCQSFGVVRITMDVGMDGNEAVGKYRGGEFRMTQEGNKNSFYGYWENRRGGKMGIIKFVYIKRRLIGNWRVGDKPAKKIKWHRFSCYFIGK